MTTSSSFLGRWWWRRFHPLVRKGWESLTGGGDPAMGVGLIAVGYLLQQRAKRGQRQVLYRATLQPGESIRIRVARGHRPIADRIIEG